MAKEIVSSYLGNEPILPETDGSLVMIGKVAGSWAIEFYYDMTGSTITLKQISALLKRIGMEDRFSDLMTLANKARSFSSSLEKEQWPDTTYGFSMAVEPDGTVTVFTIFTFADYFVGGDGETRHAVLSLADQYGWDFSLYGQLTKPFIRSPYKYEYHNIISFAVAGNNETGLAISLSPPGPVKSELTDAPGTILDRNIKPLKPFPNQETTARKITPDGELLEEIIACQCDSGAFLSHVTLDNGNEVPDENGFVTAQVLRYLADIPRSDTLDRAREKALDFLLTCEIETRPGAFSFWPQNAHPQWMGATRLPPDVDDSSIISLELYKHKRRDYYYIQHVASTVILPYRLETVNKTLHPWKHSGCFNTWLDHDHQPNPVDCCVNVNALTLLTVAGVVNRLPYFSAIDMVNDGLGWAGDSLQRVLTLTPYYPNPTELYFSIKNALAHNVSALGESFALFKEQWEETLLTNYRENTPVYSREDGIILWTAPVLFKARKLFYKL